MIDRRQFVIQVGAGITAIPTWALGQQWPSIPTVGFIILAKRDPTQIEAFELGLREHGLEPGRTVLIEERYGDGNRDGVRQPVAALLAAGVRLFVAGGPNVARMIHEQSRDVAIVVASLESLSTAGVTGSIARPEGNVTGFATLGSELMEKRLELLREIIPGLRRIVIVINTSNRNHSDLVAAVKRAGERSRIEVGTIEITERKALESSLKSARAAGAEVALFPRDFLFESMRAEIVAAAAAAGLASDFDEREFVRLGGLMSYSPNRPDLFRRSAAYVVKILAGAKPSDLPIQQPTKFELVVNLKTAQALGLTVPPSILIRADEVIE